ncbi:MAG: FAD-binding oxidoreductase [Elainella sp.]
MSAIVQVEKLLGSEAVMPWEQVEPSLQGQISRALQPGSTPAGVVYPASLEALAEVVACAHLNRWRILPCGAGSKLHWGGLAAGAELVVSMARLNRLIEFASGDLTVTAEAGMTLVALQAEIGKTGQFLAVDPAYPDRATLGGIVATADTGALRQRYGGIRDLLIGLTLVRSDGKIAKAGGRVVKNVAGYDLMKLLTGSYGTLGILAQLSFRLYPLPQATTTLMLTGDAARLAQLTATLLASALTPTAIELLSGARVQQLAASGQTGSLAPAFSDLGLVVRFQNIEVSVVQQAEQLAALAQQIGLTSQRVEQEDALWQQLRAQIDALPPEGGITCKIGVEPARAVELLSQMDAELGTIHAGSGLGTVHLPFADFPSDPAVLAAVQRLRQSCQQRGGFLSVLAAPVAFKQQCLDQQIDLWGYTGDALDVMQRLKAQFDPESLLSPRRFVGQI